VQMLAYLTAAVALAQPGSSAAVMATAALSQLLAPGVDYGGNIVNTKIEAPTDDNFSDDELTFLPFATLCLACTSPTLNCSAVYPTLWQQVQLAVGRTYLFVSRSRPSLWGLVWGLCQGPPGGQMQQRVWDDVAWQLGNWPRDHIDWPLINSNRADVVVDPQPDRNGRFGVQSRSILPPRERGTYRWNANPFYMDSGGQGVAAFEPGAAVLPIRLAGWMLANGY